MRSLKSSVSLMPALLLASLLLGSLLLASTPALAQGTRTWQQSKFEEFEKGTSKGVALRSDGTIELAPAFDAVFTTPSTYLWAMAADAQGNIYAAAGSPARVYRITPAGKASVIFEPRELQVQALVLDPGGALYAATSPDGKVYKIQAGHSGSGKKSEEEVRSDAARSDADPKVAADKSDNKTASSEGSAASNPAASQGPPAAAEVKSDIPVDSNYSATTFFDPKTRYIWNMVLDKEGRLYVATGDHGEIYRVSKSGEGSVFFKSDEGHIRSLAIDGSGNVIAGTDGSGLIYRISPAGEGFVLYSAPKKEITALAVDTAGNIYAAGVGEKRAGSTPTGQSLIFSAPNMGAATGITFGQVNPGISFPPQVTFPGMTGAMGSELYLIAPDGTPRRLWSAHDDIIYAFAFDANGRLLAGTGNRGRVYVVQPNGDFTSLVKASANQVSAFASAPGGGIYAATSNLGKIFRLAGKMEAEGTFESEVFDAHSFSRWGRAQVRGSGNFDFLARSGNVDNPDRNWSTWRKVDLGKDTAMDVPAARFIQWKAVLRPGGRPATVESVLLNYRASNVAPVIEDVTVQSGARFQPMPKVQTENTMINIGGSQQPAAPVVRFDPPTPAMKDRNSIAVRWTAHDDNEDDLTFSLYYRGDGETRWKLLKDKITDRFYSWDAALLPDGGYALKVVASDAPSHSPDDVLTAEKESQRFEVDTTPPRVDQLAATVEGDQMHVTFRAQDSFSPIKRAEYSIDAGDWQFVEPVGKLSDAMTENYDFNLLLDNGGARPVAVRSRRKSASSQKAPAGTLDEPDAAADPAEHVVVVRVYDRFDNIATAKTVVHGK